MEGSTGQEMQAEVVEQIARQIRMFLAVKHAKTDAMPHEIIPGLFLGSIGAAMNKTNLQSLAITHVLTVADKITPMHPSDFEYKVIEILDSEEQNLKERIPECIDFCHSVLQSGSKILVHWFAGRSRSTTVVLAYLMKYQGMSLEQAHSHVLAIRSQIMPNAGFWKQLQEFENEISRIA